MVAWSKIEFSVPCIACLCSVCTVLLAFLSVFCTTKKCRCFQRGKWVSCSWFCCLSPVLFVMLVGKDIHDCPSITAMPTVSFYGWEGARKKRCLREAAGWNWAKSCGIPLHSTWGRKPVGFPGQDRVSLVLQWIPKAGHGLCVKVGHDCWMWNLWISTKLSPKPRLAGGSAVCSTDYRRTNSSDIIARGRKNYILVPLVCLAIIR